MDAHQCVARDLIHEIHNIGIAKETFVDITINDCNKSFVYLNKFDTNQIVCMFQLKKSSTQESNEKFVIGTWWQTNSSFCKNHYTQSINIDKYFNVGCEKD